MPIPIIAEPHPKGRVLDALYYGLTLTRLRILDALCGASLPTPADE